MEELSVDDGLVLFGRWIVIQKFVHRDLLRKLHAAHQGFVRGKRRARQRDLDAKVQPRYDERSCPFAPFSVGALLLGG
jgi:hypothetical protein